MVREVEVVEVMEGQILKIVKDGMGFVLGLVLVLVVPLLMLLLGFDLKALCIAVDGFSPLITANAPKTTPL